jgi:DNA-binding MarR family transcriptional regulator
MEFERIPLYWVNRLSALSRRELVTRFRAAGHDISAEEWATLLLLWREDGQTPGALSRRTVRDPTTMTRLVDAMVRKRLVTRRMDESDRRRSLICLTEYGRRLESELVPVAQAMIAQALEGVCDSDAATTISVLSRMVDNLSRDD